MFYFVRHGKTDYSEKNTKIYQGYGVNLAPMSETGIMQIKETAKDERLKGTDIILTSPYTRAVQTASILSKELGVDIKIETDLHEWLANKNFVYDSVEAMDAAFREYEKNQGKYPDGEEKAWESKEALRKRILSVLEKYKGYEKVIVAGHGLMIQAVTQGKLPECGEITEFEF